MTDTVGTAQAGSRYRPSSISGYNLTTGFGIRDEHETVWCYHVSLAGLAWHSPPREAASACRAEKLPATHRLLSGHHFRGFKSEAGRPTSDKETEILVTFCARRQSNKCHFGDVFIEKLVRAPYCELIPIWPRSGKERPACFAAQSGGERAQKARAHLLMPFNHLHILK